MSVSLFTVAGWFLIFAIGMGIGLLVGLLAGCSGRQMAADDEISRGLRGD